METISHRKTLIWWTILKESIHSNTEHIQNLGKLFHQNFFFLIRNRMLYPNNMFKTTQFLLITVVLIPGCTLKSLRELLKFSADWALPNPLESESLGGKSRHIFFSASPNDSNVQSGLAATATERFLSLPAAILRSPNFLFLYFLPFLKSRCVHIASPLLKSKFLEGGIHFHSF